MAPDQSPVTLIVFDVDGTLYRQTPLRWRMARELILYTLGNRDTSAFRVLRRYRSVREALADDETPDFDVRAREAAARASRCSRATVDAIVAEWIDKRPLRHLVGFALPGRGEVFRRSARQRAHDRGAVGFSSGR
ncbi:MAG: hypothetical protein U5K56_13505 [Halioglobus sp.]|nr:hypothetical protein [Halioglobus sp.]